jgi:hypothetical protein
MRLKSIEPTHDNPPLILRLPARVGDASGNSPRSAKFFLPVMGVRRRQKNPAQAKLGRGTRTTEVRNYL